MRKEPLGGDRLFVVHDCLDSAECRDHIARSEREGYGDATITTGRGVMVNREVRSNARIMVDDAELGASLWDRLRPLIPPIFEGWHVVGLNERFRFYRDDSGRRVTERFAGERERYHPTRSSRVTFTAIDRF